MGRLLDGTTNSSQTQTGGRLLLASQQEDARKSAAVNSDKATLRSMGEPVSNSSDHAAPTFLGNIVRAPLKLLADVGTNLVNAGQVAIGHKETQPFSGDYLGKVSGLGKIDVTKSPLDPENLKTIKKSVGTGAEIASYLIGGGAAGGVAKDALTATAKTAAKQTLKEFIAKSVPVLAKEGAAMGFTGSVGSQLRENADKGTPLSLKKTAIDTAAGTLLNPILGTVLNRVLGPSSSKVLKARQAVNDAETIANKTVTPDVNPNIGPSVPSTSKVDIPNPNYVEPTVTPKAQSEITSTPEFKAKVEEGAQVIARDKPESTTPGNFQKDSQAVYEHLSQNPEQVKRIAMGEEVPTNGVPADAYLSIMKNEAAKSGDVNLIDELSNSNVASTSGRKLGANRLTSEDNIVDTIRALKQNKLSSLSKSTQEKLLNEKNRNLVQSLQDLVNFKPSTEIIHQIVDTLMCR